ncbi:hypothetical protein GTO27_13185 [Candidatus Bathyarchaeota archaeon]|nr:hypothetical protein [Candidatus Bathyarchaeota archaeon]
MLLSNLSFFVAYGLLLGEKWAWKLTLIVDVIYIALTTGLFALHDTLNHFTLFYLFLYMHPAPLWLLSWGSSITRRVPQPTPTNIDILVSLFTFILPHIIIILYLMLPHVKAFFLRAESPIHKPERAD